MTQYEIDRIERAIRHIQTAVDVDTWAVEIAVDAMKRMIEGESDRKKGKWEIYIISPFDGEGCRCSECRQEGAPYWGFCPNCGAKMEEVKYDER